MGKRIKRQSINHEVPEEIIEEILTNLPVKSLIRFKCVSKQWCSIISSKSFIQEHLKKSMQFNRQHLIYSSFDTKPNDRNYGGFDHTHQRLRSCSLNSFLDEPKKGCSKITTLDNHPGNPDLFSQNTKSCNICPYSVCIRIIGSCNGLVLVTFNFKDIFLWNLSTRKFKSIPTTYFPKKSLYHKFQYGFGYDDSTDDYKIVCTSFCAEPYQTKIYSLKTDSWKRIENFDKGSPLGIGSEGIFVKGKFYWETMDWKAAEKCDRWKIVSLSFVEEKFEFVARPKHFLEYEFNARVLQVLGGYLSFVGISSTLDVNIWVMNKYSEANQETWTKIWTLSDFAHPKRYINGPRPKPLWLNKNGDIGVAFGESIVVVYNYKSKSRMYRVDEIILTSNIYVESLVSPFGDQDLSQ
ncbi:hypothetical protein ACP275_14G295000 [Erythranthe tilingii]